MERLSFEYGFLDGDVVLELDRTVFTEELAQAVIDFSSWSLDEERDIVEEACRKIAFRCFVFATLNGYNTEGVINNVNQLEGIPLLDGSVGVRLVSTDSFEFIEEDFKLKTD